MKLNRTLPLISESPTVKLNSLAKSLAAGGKKIINLTAGELDFDTPAYIRKAVSKQLINNKYTPTLGFWKLRQMLAKQVTQDYGIKFGPENLAVTAGSKSGLYESLSVILNPGDEVIIPVPYWPTHVQQILLLGAKPVLVPLTAEFDLDVSLIKKKITPKTKAVIFNSPHNPTGTVFSRKALQNLQALLSKRSIYVLSDDVYAKINFDKGYVSPAKFVSNKKFLILISAFSKSQALTGWRIGYVAADKRIIDAINAFQSHMSGNASVISQLAAIEILKRRDKADKFVKVLNKRKNLVTRMLRTIRGISFRIPAGAFYFFIDISRIAKNSERFCQNLLRSGLALVPGEAFGKPGFVRLSFAASNSDLVEGLKILKKFCEQSKS
ncbi:MAG: aminotransferase class I/II-fold pyridoxal phosphate-dependent enzyme [Candidatus Doudnabacteria bacterium]|nr:aminotransferase class I/II-fold pyridoxal phosphate-dependent enzyme [Candidatus Doudnabacteria bacterium]